MSLVGDQYFVIIRLLSLLIGAFLYFTVPVQLYLDFYFAILFSHYTLAFVKARHKAAAVAMSPRSYPPLLVLVGATALYPITGLPNVIFYFGFHHAANDAYMRFNLDSGSTWRAGYSSRFALFVLNLASFFIITRHDPNVSWIPLPLLVALYAFGAVAFLADVFRTLPSLRLKAIIEALLFEWINFMFVIVSLAIYMPISGIDFIIYHLLLWIFLSTWTYENSRHKFNFSSPVINLGLAAVFFLITPSAGIFLGTTNELLQRQANIWGFVHVSFTFAVSALNPEFIRNLFKPEPLDLWRRSFSKNAG